MIFHENFCQQLGMMLQNFSSAAVVIGALRVKTYSMKAQCGC